MEGKFSLKELKNELTWKLGKETSLEEAKEVPLQSSSLGRRAGVEELADMTEMAQDFMSASSSGLLNGGFPLPTIDGMRWIGKPRHMITSSGTFAGANRKDWDL